LAAPPDPRPKIPDPKAQRRLIQFKVFQGNSRFFKVFQGKKNFLGCLDLSLTGIPHLAPLLWKIVGPVPLTPVPGGGKTNGIQVNPTKSNLIQPFKLKIRLGLPSQTPPPRRQTLDPRPQIPRNQSGSKPVKVKNHTRGGSTADWLFLTSTTGEATVTDRE